MSVALAGAVIENNVTYSTERHGIKIAAQPNDYAYEVVTNHIVRGNIVHDSAWGVDARGATDVVGGKNTLIDGNTGDSWYGVYVQGSASNQKMVVNNCVYENPVGVRIPAVASGSLLITYSVAGMGRK
jgi:hypothetical protein